MSSLMVSVISFIAGVKDRFTNEEKGATAVEYGLLVALIAAVIVGLVATLGTQIQTGFPDDRKPSSPRSFATGRLNLTSGLAASDAHRQPLARVYFWELL